MCYTCSMRSLGIRAATVLDVEDMATLHATCWDETYRGKLPDSLIDSKRDRMLEIYPKALAEPDGASYWVALWEGKMVGLASARSLGPGHARLLEVGALYILDEYKRRGVGTALLNYAIGSAPCQLWVLDGNDEAIEFYRQQGFEMTGETQSPDIFEGATESLMVR